MTSSSLHRPGKFNAALGRTPAGAQKFFAITQDALVALTRFPVISRFTVTPTPEATPVRLRLARTGSSSFRLLTA